MSGWFVSCKVGRGVFPSPCCQGLVGVWLICGSGEGGVPITSSLWVGRCLSDPVCGSHRFLNALQVEFSVSC